MRGAVPLAQGILTQFAQARIVVRAPGGAFSYAPAPGTAAIIDELAKLNGRLPLAVAKEIVLAGNDKVQTFVDAFKFKQDPEDGSL